MTRHVLAAAAVIVATSTVSGRDRLEMRAKPAFAYAPSEVQMEFRIMPDAANRALDVVAESDSFYRSSVIELEGERAPTVVSIRYHGLPAGDYSLRGALVDRAGRVLVMVEKQVTVMTTGGEH